MEQCRLTAELSGPKSRRGCCVSKSRADLLGPLQRLVRRHAAPRIDAIALDPAGDASHNRPPMFSSTVAQNANWNDDFLDLCRNTCIATRAPGQPPRRPTAC